MSLKAGGRIAEVSCVAELVKSFGFPSLSKVLTTSATELKFGNAKRRDRVQMQKNWLPGDQLVTSPPAMVEAPR